MISFEHANADCTGSQLQVDMNPADGTKEGVFTFCIRPQLTAPQNIGRRKRVPAEFGGDSAHASLNAKKATHLLMVLEGKMTNTNFGKGVYDNGDGYVSVLHCDRVYEPAAGFAFHIITKYDDEPDKSRNQRILLNATEATALAKAIGSSMGLVSFGRN